MAKKFFKGLIDRLTDEVFNKIFSGIENRIDDKKRKVRLQ